MFDSVLRIAIDPPLNMMARGLAKTPVTGTMLTWLGFFFGLMTCGAVALQYGVTAFILLIINRFCDGLDGAVARARGEASAFGGYLDITLDYLIYAGLPFFAALGLMDQTAFLAAGFVIYSFIGSGVSFLAYAIIAAKRDMHDNDHQGKKAFYFASGFMEGAETIVFMAFICLFPHAFEVICYVFGTLCWLTTVARLHMAWRVFS